MTFVSCYMASHRVKLFCKRVCNGIVFLRFGHPEDLYKLIPKHMWAEFEQFMHTHDLLGKNGKDREQKADG